MQNVKRLVQWSRVPFISAVVAFLLVGCQSDKDQSGVKITVIMPTPAVTAPAPAVAAPVAPPAPAATMAAGLPIRIDAGATAAHTDFNGNVWLPDQGFVDGDVIDRGSDTQIANTQDQAIYRTERYGMRSEEHTSELQSLRHLVCR